MRVLVCLGFVLAATAAEAQNTTTINRETRSVTTSGNGYGATTRQVSHTTSVTTITRTTGGYHPMGQGGYHPMGQ